MLRFHIPLIESRNAQANEYIARKSNLVPFPHPRRRSFPPSRRKTAVAGR